MVVACICPPVDAATLDEDAERVLRQFRLGKTEVGLYAVDLVSGQVLIDHNGDMPLIPASNMKLLTSAAACDTLGADFMFRTELRRIDLPKAAAPKAVEGSAVEGSAVEGGAVEGGAEEHTPALPTLVIIGDGDPAFGDPKLLERHGLDHEQLLGMWVDAVKQAGIEAVDRVLVDDRVFDREFVHPTWPDDQLNKWYCAEVAGVNFNNNCLDLYPSPTRVGRAPRVRVVPDSPSLSFSNEATTTKKNAFWISRPPNTNDFTFRGTVKSVFIAPVNITVHDPPIWVADLLADRLRNAGVRVGGVGRAPQVTPAGEALHFMQTPLDVVLQRCNTDSQNLFAEALIKRVGHAATDKPGGWDNGAPAMRSALRRRVGHLVDAISIADGSGMSRDNRVTAHLIGELLRHIYSDESLRPIYLQSLAIGGRTGTLRKRLRGLDGDVAGKSGFINQVSALSGYVMHGEGEQHRAIAFSFLFNGFSGNLHNGHMKKLQDDLVRMLDEHLSEQFASSQLGG